MTLAMTSARNDTMKTQQIISAKIAPILPAGNAIRAECAQTAALPLILESSTPLQRTAILWMAITMSAETIPWVSLALLNASLALTE